MTYKEAKLEIERAYAPHWPEVVAHKWRDRHWYDGPGGSYARAGFTIRSGPRHAFVLVTLGGPVDAFGAKWEGRNKQTLAEREAGAVVEAEPTGTPEALVALALAELPRLIERKRAREAGRREYAARGRLQGAAGPLYRAALRARNKLREVAGGSFYTREELDTVVALLDEALTAAGGETVLVEFPMLAP